MGIDPALKVPGGGGGKGEKHLVLCTKNIQRKRTIPKRIQIFHSLANSTLILKVRGVCLYGLSTEMASLEGGLFISHCRLVHGDLACAHWENRVVSGREGCFRISASFSRIS